MATKQANNDLLLWHQRFNHLNFDSLCSMGKQSLVMGMPSDFPAENPVCEHCAYRKLSVKPFPSKSSSVINQPLQLVVTDICGKLSPSIGTS
jgi:hypothetical protein